MLELNPKEAEWANLDATLGFPLCHMDEYLITIRSSLGQITAPVVETLYLYMPPKQTIGNVWEEYCSKEPMKVALLYLVPTGNSVLAKHGTPFKIHRFRVKSSSEPID